MQPSSAAVKEYYSPFWINLTARTIITEEALVMLMFQT